MTRRLLPALLLFAASAPLRAGEPDPTYGAHLDAVQEALPVRGTPVFDGSRLDGFRLGGQGNTATYSVVPASDQPFGRALRVRVHRRTDKPWDVQLQTPAATVPLRKGEKPGGPTSRGGPALTAPSRREASWAITRCP